MVARHPLLVARLPDTHRLARGNLWSARADALADRSDERVYGCLNSRLDRDEHLTIWTTDP
jgi:hypothetical protein